MIFYHISAKGPINWDAFGIFFLQYLTRLRKTLSCLNIFRCRILVCLQYILHLVKYNVIKNAPIYFCLFCFFFLDESKRFVSYLHISLLSQTIHIYLQYRVVIHWSKILLALTMVPIKADTSLRKYHLNGKVNENNYNNL